MFALAATKTALLSASGSSTIRIHATNAPDFPLTQKLEGAHKLGVHHLVASKDGRRATSAGFEGRVKVWGVEEVQEEAESGAGGTWKAVGEISGRYGCFQFTLRFTRGTGRQGRNQGIVRGRDICGLFLSANSPSSRHLSMRSLPAPSLLIS